MKNEKSKPRRNLNEILVYGDLVSVFPDTLKGSETRGSDPHAVANWRRKSGSSTSGIWDSHTFHKTSTVHVFRSHGFLISRNLSIPTVETARNSRKHPSGQWKSFGRVLLASIRYFKISQFSILLWVSPKVNFVQKWTKVEDCLRKFYFWELDYQP